MKIDAVKANYYFLYISLFMLIGSAISRAETVIVYNDNGNGGIHQTVGQIVVDDGQYFLNIAFPGYNGTVERKHLKVQRVKDSARLMYNQDEWAEKYLYVVEINRGFSLTDPYYFNMDYEWIPSPTEDSSYPERIITIKKLYVYYDNWNGGWNTMKTVLIKKGCSYLLYYGDEMFAAVIERNYNIPSYAPSWVHRYSYKSQISGFTVYFNF